MLSRKRAAIRMALQKGWAVNKLNDDGTIDELMAVSTTGEPIYYRVYNVNAAKSTRADHLNIGGSLGLNLDGQNMTAHVWDGGPTRPTHQEFDGAGGNNRVTINDGVTALNGNSFHAQHVTGTIVASGYVAAAKGMAPQAKALTHDWNSDLAEATTEAANGMLISNHSYGYRASLIPDWYFGAYIDESRDWDNLMYNSPYYLMVVAAGNDGNDNSSNAQPLNGNSSYDKLNGHSTSKNNMVVANGQDANVNADGTLNSVIINSGSSEGPTDDLRIKPDITGNGTGLYSCYDNSDAAYNSISGTSMASPNVSGTLLLLQQHYNNLNGSFMRASTLKGLALHTADDAGPTGPDAAYGWGLLNAKRAAEAISQNGNESKVEEITLANGGSYTTTVESDGVSNLLASISWTDPAGIANTGTANLTTPVLVNDLDIRVTQSSSTYTPYKLTNVNANTQGDNNVDPFERVDVVGASGSYTVTVTHKGSLSGGNQTFSLIVTGISGTPVVCNATTPTNLINSNVGSSTADLTWDPVPGASYDVRYRETGSSTWTVNEVPGNSTTLTGLTPLTEYEAQVRSKCPDASTSAFTTSTVFTTTEVQLNYCASNGNNTSDEYIGRVQLGSIDNSTGASIGGYGDYTSLSTDLIVNSSATITITPTWTGPLYNEGYSVWIDYNQDGDFADAGEQVYSRSPTTASPVGGSFTIPSTATEGNTRMRVSMKYNGIPTPCESFTYGEVEDYTVNITSPVPDTEAPTAPSNLTSSNVTQNSVDLDWNASTDNIGVTQYNVYQDGVAIDNTTGTNYVVTGLTASTSYNFTVTAQDAAGNESASSNAVNVTTSDPPAGCTDVIVNFNDFESGWGIWNDGGSDCRRSSNDASYANGTYAIRLRDNTSSSVMTTDNLDLSAFESLTVSFSYYARSMDNSNEDFWLQISTNGGSSYTTVEEWNQGDEFVNNTRYNDAVTVTGTFSTNTRIRFRCDASGNSDWVYIDDVLIEGCSNSPSSVNTIASTSARVESFVEQETLDLDFDLEEISVYPNPTFGKLYLKNLAPEANIRIVNLAGKVMFEGINVQYIDMSSYNPSVYLLQISLDEEIRIIKILKQ